MKDFGSPWCVASRLSSENIVKTFVSFVQFLLCDEESMKSTLTTRFKPDDDDVLVLFV